MKYSGVPLFPGVLPCRSEVYIVVWVYASYGPGPLPCTCRVLCTAQPGQTNALACGGNYVWRGTARGPKFIESLFPINMTAKLSRESYEAMPLVVLNSLDILVTDRQTDKQTDAGKTLSPA